MTKDEMTAIVPHPDWADGRTGYLWCRFDARLVPQSDPRHLRAEITWDDDAEGDPAHFFAPELKLETNYYAEPGCLKTYAFLRIVLRQDETLELVTHDPREILTKYADVINRLKTYPGTDHA